MSWRIGNVERDVGERWTRAYAVASMMLCALMAWSAVKAADWRSDYFAPPLDYVPWRIFTTMVLAIAAYGAVRRRAWAGFVGLFGGLCLLAYPYTVPFVFSHIAAYFPCVALGTIAVAVHLPVVVLSIRRDALAGGLCALLTLASAVGLSLGWALGLRADDACRGDYAWQQQIACPEWVLTAREQGRRAARHDRDAGVHRVLSSGVPHDEVVAYRHWLWTEYGVQTTVLASCLVPAAVFEYERGYDEVARPWLDAHLASRGGWNEVQRRWRSLGGDGPNAPTAPTGPYPWPVRPLVPPPPE